ncbi:pyrroline-5-carboxylate reductase 3 isoform X4 [Syngnathoides biaculeatus]|uniref:pyrroline-5-carboxylate reductase 3 isoform X4 n=1 Tax=Syngnathoides biaculeatus TaxID=300417 RepID=UPI002ADD721B|nr:pyrroline-5-carboxylate reductase 3 isoform X4 [Syngnathoides biaculeatus]
MFWGYGRKPECPAKTHGGTGRTYKLTQVGPDMNPDPQNCEANNPQLLHHAAHIKSEPKMDSQFRIGFIGAGNIAFGIAKGILSGSVLPTNVKVSAPSPRNLGRFQELNISTSHSNTEVVCHSDVIFVAVKPHIVPTVLSEISQHVTNRHTIVSVAAGVTLATLEEVYLFAEALADGAVKMGMPSTLAQRIASQTVLGAGHLLRNSNKHPAQLRSEVCTPGGTTIFGLHALEQGGVRASTITAVESATERARELGQMSAAPGSRK